MDLQTLANLAEIFGVLTVVGGVFFGASQLREFRNQRRYSIAAELMRSFYNPQFAHAIQLIRQMPVGVTAEQLRDRGPEYEEAAILISTTYETMGLLVFHGMAPFSMVRELTGGFLMTAWQQLGQWVEDIRVEQQQPSWAEWFQWLAERTLEWNASRETRPAYVEHANWTPRE